MFKRENVENLKMMPAYFTVEAAMVLPMVFSVVIIIIYMMFFQYNRCLMEQDIGILVLRGSILPEDNKDRLLKMLQKEAQRIDDNKLVAWENGEIEVKIEKNRLKISQSGKLKFPFHGFGIGGEHIWNTRVEYENERIEPTSFIRNYRKLAGGY